MAIRLLLVLAVVSHSLLCCGEAARRMEAWHFADDSLSEESLPTCTSMTAAAIEGPTKKRAVTKPVIVETEIPKVGRSQVLIRVEASSINALDLLWTAVGKRWWWFFQLGWQTQFWASWPKVLGLDAAGTVEAVGRNVKDFKVGDEVWAFNAHGVVTDGRSFGTFAGKGWAEFAVLSEASVGLKPKNMNFTEAATVPLVAETSLGALRGAGSSFENKTVVVVGATSGTGYFGVQLAKALGAAKVIAVASKKNFEYLEELGVVDEFIDYRTQDWAEVLANESVDVVYDTVQKDPLVGEKAYAKLREGGTFVCLANTQPPWAGAYFLPSRSTRKQNPSKRYYVHRCMPGGFGLPQSVGGGCASTANLNYLRELVESGKLRTRIHAKYELPQINDAIDKYLEGRTVGKIAVTVDSNKSCTPV